MSINTYVKVGGTHTQAKRIYVKNAGAWVEANAAYVNVAGTWTQVFSNQLVITLSSTVTNYDLYTAAVAAYGSSSLPPRIKLVVASGGIIGGVAGSISTFGGSGSHFYIANSDSGSPYYSTLNSNGRWGLDGASGLVISNSFAAGTTIEVQINSGGAIYGGAGCGGISGEFCGNPSYRYGGAAGNAIQVNGTYSIAITNAGNIWGGGGGGAGAPNDQYCDARRYGGVGYGYESQIAGSYSNSPIPAFGGSGTGGAGGGWASAGSNNSSSNSYGGAAGKAINNAGSSTITLTNTGSILGATS